jgi:hypothetical protein
VSVPPILLPQSHPAWYRQIVNALTLTPLPYALAHYLSYVRNSPPSSIPKPASPPRGRFGLPPGGSSESKLRRRRASLAASGVLAGPGVRLNAPCAGLGVTLQKSAKLNAWPGVLKPLNRLWLPPGVLIIDDGSGAGFDGGVDGAMARFDAPFIAAAGDGEVARYSSRSAPSSPAAPSFLLRCRRPRGRLGGGVRGGDPWKTAGMASSSFSNRGDSEIVEALETKEKLGASAVDAAKLAEKRVSSGDDASPMFRLGRWLCSGDDCELGRLLRALRDGWGVLDMRSVWKRVRLRGTVLLPSGYAGSENMGAVMGEDWYGRVYGRESEEWEGEEEPEERTLVSAPRCRSFSKRASTMLKDRRSSPFLALYEARARRSCNLRLIYGGQSRCEVRWRQGLLLTLATSARRRTRPVTSSSGVPGRISAIMATQIAFSPAQWRTMRGEVEPSSVGG